MNADPFRPLPDRAAYEADLVVWTATAGGAAMPVRLPFPKPRNHAEEIANARAEEALRTG